MGGLVSKLSAPRWLIDWSASGWRQPCGLRHGLRSTRPSSARARFCSISNLGSIGCETRAGPHARRYDYWRRSRPRRERPDHSVRHQSRRCVHDGDACGPVRDHVSWWQLWRVRPKASYAIANPQLKGYPPNIPSSLEPSRRWTGAIRQRPDVIFRRAHRQILRRHLRQQSRQTVPDPDFRSDGTSSPRASQLWRPPIEHRMRIPPCRAGRAPRADAPGCRLPFACMNSAVAANVAEDGFEGLSRARAHCAWPRAQTVTAIPIAARIALMMPAHPAIFAHRSVARSVAFCWVASCSLFSTSQSSTSPRTTSRSGGSGSEWHRGRRPDWQS